MTRVLGPVLWFWLFVVVAIAWARRGRRAG